MLFVLSWLKMYEVDKKHCPVQLYIHFYFTILTENRSNIFQHFRWKKKIHVTKIHCCTETSGTKAQRGSGTSTIHSVIDYCFAFVCYRTSTHLRGKLQQRQLQFQQQTVGRKQIMKHHGHGHPHMSALGSRQIRKQTRWVQEGGPLLHPQTSQRLFLCPLISEKRDHILTISFNFTLVPPGSVRQNG